MAKVFDMNVKELKRTTDRAVEYSTDGTVKVEGKLLQDLVWEIIDRTNKIKKLRAKLRKYETAGSSKPS
jgi:hypothetical protein